MIPKNENTQLSDKNRRNGPKNVGSFVKEGISIDQLRNDLKGQVIAPGDPDYDEARKLFSGAIDSHPAVIIRPENPTEVSYVVSLARDTGHQLAVRSGGHSFAGHSTAEGGIVLDLKNMRALDIDTEHRMAWAETGLTASEYITATDAYGLATGFGDTGTVGIGGITLGGGIGFLVRKYGLTIDSLLAAEVVTADGQIRHVDAENHPDLFWAIRGGGGNFGVATRFLFQLHPVEQVVGGPLILPATPQVLAGFMEAAENAPDELSTIANIMPAPPMPFIPAEYHGKLVIFGMMLFIGSAEAAERAYAPFRALAKPIADLTRPMRYKEMFPPEEGEYRPTAVARSLFLDYIGRAEAETILEYLQNSDAAMRVAQIRVLGGAMARVPADATAFAHRKSRILASLAAFYNGPEEQAKREDWVTRFVNALQQEDRGAYVNFMADEGEERVRDAYPGRTWDRLAEIKALYDPTNLFRLNQNISPEKNGK